MQPIGFVRSCFKEKFGVARQSLMIAEATGVLKLNPSPDFRLAVSGLKTFSHLWVIFIFHKNLQDGWQSLVTPPRTEENKIGVFASRSPHRPNPIGLSCVKVQKIDLSPHDGIEIHVSGLDILDESPILDIKPYLPYADAIQGANSGWAQAEIKKYPVRFSLESLDAIHKLGDSRHPNLKGLLTQMLELDPRPTSQRKAIPMEAPESEGRKFAFRLFDFDVHWQISDAGVRVMELV